ncbi:hypothetical protein [Dysgonomonas sp.]
MNKIKLTIILTLFCALCTAAYGQVTVGSGNKPVNGALLDIKENDDAAGGATAKKGLLMPRVNLSKKDQLYPMYEDNGSGGYKIGVANYIKADEDKKHIGLLVYNLAAVDDLEAGVHSWDGSRWVAVKSGSGPAGTYNFVDPIIYDSGSGNVYLQAGTADGQVLKWNNTASKWEAGTDANTTYTGTAPIAINGSNQISLTDGGVTNIKIAANAVTTDKIQNATILGEDIANTTITQNKLMGSGIIGQVLTTTTANAAPTWVTPTDNDTQYTGTAPITVTGTDISLANGGVELVKLTPGGASGQVLTSNGASAPSWATLSINDADYIVGNEVTNATTGGGLVRAGSGTTGSPYTLGIADNGVTTARINADAVTTAKIANANVTLDKIERGTDGYVLTATGASTAPQWKELKSGGTSLPSYTFDSGASVTLPAGSGTWILFPSWSGNTPFELFKATGTYMAHEVEIQGAGVGNLAKPSGTWVWRNQNNASFYKTVSNTNETYVEITPATDLVVTVPRLTYIFPK